MEIHNKYHDAHVAAGFCGSISPAKAWCNLRPGHANWHFATTIYPPQYYEDRRAYTWRVGIE